MNSTHIADALAQEFAAADLHLAARQYSAVVALVHAGEATQQLLRARQATLEEAALVYATARGWRVEGETAP
jgi:hypothetical protein